MKDENNKPQHMIIMIIGIILYIILYLFMGPLLPESMRAYVGIGSVVQIAISTVLVVTNQKRGFIASCILNLIACIMALMGYLHGQTTALQGVAIDIIAVLMLYIIYHFLERSEKQRVELSNQYEQLMDSNRLMQEKDEALRTLAYKDPMTGMYNQAYLSEQIAEAIQRSVPFSLIYMDLDNFKGVNDTFGPKTGDAALKIYADRISAYCGNKYICARTSGDDFAILLTGQPTEADILNMIEQLRQMLAEPITIQGANISITTASYGIAAHPRDGRSVDAILDSAIMAVYNAKANGKDRPCFFSQA
ncbi:MAG: GGDEF domain-containing protein [Oscillospiraceae bacterium]|nr:GGDEF domain-containing protein [Oscillospiraceae bacterium]